MNDGANYMFVLLHGVCASVKFPIFFCCCWLCCKCTLCVYDKIANENRTKRIATATITGCCGNRHQNQRNFNGSITNRHTVPQVNVLEKRGVCTTEHNPMNQHNSPIVLIVFAEMWENTLCNFGWAYDLLVSYHLEWTNTFKR